MNNSLKVSNKTFIDFNASIILTEWLYKGSIPLQLSNLNYIIMKLSKHIRTNWYYINREVLFILTVLFFLIFFCANFTLNLIDFLTSKF